MRVSASLPQTEIVETLAKRLHQTMERLDPSEQEDWSGLRELEREFYRSCVRDLLLEEKAIRDYLGLPGTT